MSTTVVTFRGTSAGPRPLRRENRPGPQTPVSQPTFEMKMPGPSQAPAPDLVRGVYQNDLNLLKIDAAIRAAFASRLGKLDEYKAELKSLETKLNEGYLTYIESQKVRDRLRSLEAETEGLCSGSFWEAYISRAKPLIERYLPLASDGVRGVVRFGGQRQEAPEPSERLEARLRVIEEFLTLASEYLRLDIVRDVGLRTVCPNCGTGFEEMILEEDEGIHLCPCGYEQANLVKTSSYKDSARVNISGRSQYEDRSTFIRAFERAQGQKANKIPEKLYAMLDEYFTHKGFPTGQEIRRLENLPDGKKPRTSVGLIAEALAATGNAAYYDSIPTITHNYWGWILPDLSAYRDAIIADYDATQKVYEEIKERESSLNVQIRLYLHLRARDYPCELSDFKILTSRESLEYHHRMWKVMCERTGVKFTPII